MTFWWALSVYLSVLVFFIWAWELLFGSYVLWGPWCLGPSLILRLNLISLLPDRLQPPFITPCLPLFYSELDPDDRKLMSCCTRGSLWLRFKHEELQNHFRHTVNPRSFVGGQGSPVQIKRNLWHDGSLAGLG